MGGDDVMVEQIQKFIEEKRDEGKIINSIIRDDVFSILEKECTVLYYYLDDAIEGFHISKPVRGEQKQFVFINTQKVLQEQVWTAGHELGHVWKVDQYVKNNCANCSEDIETIIGKFTAELLMPKENFRAEIQSKLTEYQYKGTVMSQEMMIELVTYLMNFFAVPEKAIIRRFSELGYIKREHIEVYLDSFRAGADYYKKIITEKQYTRLDKTREVYSMGNIHEDILQLEKKELVKSKYVKHVRAMFHIDDNPNLQEQLQFEG